jgi:hypothetical protein
VLGGDLDLAGRNPKQRFAVDDEPRHAADATRLGRNRRISSNRARSVMARAELEPAQARYGEACRRWHEAIERLPSAATNEE